MPEMSSPPAKATSPYRVAVIFVIVVASCLSGFAAMVYFKARVSYRLASTRSVLHSLTLAIRNFTYDQQQPPWPDGPVPTDSSTRDIIRELAPHETGLLGKVPTINVGLRTYLVLPKKALAKTDSGVLLVDAWGSEYQISYDPVAKKVFLWSNGPDGIDQTSTQSADAADDIRVYLPDSTDYTNDASDGVPASNSAQPQGKSPE